MVYSIHPCSTFFLKCWFFFLSYSSHYSTPSSGGSLRESEMYHIIMKILYRSKGSSSILHYLRFIDSKYDEPEYVRLQHVINGIHSSPTQVASLKWCIVGLRVWSSVQLTPGKYVIHIVHHELNFIKLSSTSSESYFMWKWLHLRKG